MWLKLKFTPKSKRSELQTEFNNFTPASSRQVYDEDEIICQKCGGGRVGRIQANDEYYDICDDCGYEQYD